MFNPLTLKLITDREEFTASFILLVFYILSDVEDIDILYLYLISIPMPYI